MGTSAETRAPSIAEALASLTLPDLDGLSEQQVRGAACVWTGIILTPETAVDLGKREASRAGQPVPWFPRATWAAVQHAAHSQVLDHAAVCEQCADDITCCETGLALWRLMKECRAVNAKVGGGLPCEPCMTAKIFGKPGEEHPCTGSAHSPVAGPCPCCGPAVMPKFCARCQRAILPYEEWEERDVIAPTGPGGGTFYLHKALCRRPYSQTTPHSIRH